ncbi:uncharacterized protein [Amphiura filiformis]|uniref:uncharacterized protein n=1 Tax=Amphiura filiformis TaxID=82378 RepID=UPI003B2217BC
MFADDTKLYNRVKKDSTEGSDAIQDDLNQLKDWSDTWLLRFNVSKCKCMHLGNDNPERSYVLGEDEIMVAKEVKDLGVYITDDCKPSTQCTKAANKAMTSLRIIKRTFKYIDKESFSILYKAYVRPDVEYCVQAGSPYQVNDIKEIEKIQRATKACSKFKRKTLPGKASGTTSLPARRLRGDLIEVFKILNGLEDIKPEELFTMSHNTGTRGHSYKLFKKQLHKGLNLRKCFFSQRVIDTWNKLPADVVNVKTTNQFKGKIDKFWNKNGYGELKGLNL